MVVLPAAGGAVRAIRKADPKAGESFLEWPVALPDGETVVYASQSSAQVATSKLALLSLKTGEATVLDVGGMYPLGVVDGLLVYVSATNAILAVPVDVAGRRVTGDPVQVGAEIQTRASGSADAALSATGTLVYRSASTVAQLVLAGPGGMARPLLDEPRGYAFPRYSPDGKRIAMSIWTGARSDVWAYDISSATNTRLTTEGSINERPEWTPDGTRILYRSDRGKRSALWWQPADLSSTASPLLMSEQHDFFEGVVTPDGKSLVFQVDDGGAQQADLEMRALAGDSTARPIAATTSIENEARVSPDGRWVAFLSNASGSAQVVVQPYPGPGAQVQVSTSGGAEPVWARDGRRLFFRDGHSLVQVAFATSPGFNVTSRTPIMDDLFVLSVSPHANYDVAPDGSRFLMVKNTDDPQLIVAYNWMAEVHARLAAKR
jgi:serine/threonine-protein kinase